MTDAGNTWQEGRSSTYIKLRFPSIICRPNGAVVTRLTRNEKIIGSIPILGIDSRFVMH